MIDKNKLHKIAQLSKLRIDRDEEDIYLEDLNRIISFINQLKDVDNKEVTDFNGVNHFYIKLRDDRSKQFQFTDLIHKKAPTFKNNYFVVSGGVKKKGTS